MESFYTGFLLFVCIFEAFLMFDFFSAFFSLKPWFQKRGASVGVVLVTAVCISCVNQLDNSAFNFAAMQVIYISLVLLVFEGSLWKRVLYDILANAIMAGSEFLFFVLSALPSDFSLISVDSDYSVMIIRMIGVKTTAFLLFNIVKRISHHTTNRMDMRSLLLYSVEPVAMLGIMAATAYLDGSYESLSTIRGILAVSCILGLIGNVLIFYAFDRYALSVQKIQQQDWRLARMEMEKAHYTQIDALNQEHEKLLHDVRHYFRVIGELAQENQATEIEKLLEELQVNYSRVGRKVFCTSPLLNAVLNEADRRAEQYGIIFEVNVEPGVNTEAFCEADFIAMVSNLLDNALEASAGCEEGRINANLFIPENQNFTVIRVTNTFTGTLRWKNGLPQTSKADKKHHGIGLPSVREAAQKCGGYLQVSQKENCFEAVVVLPSGAKNS